MVIFQLGSFNMDYLFKSIYWFVCITFLLTSKLTAKLIWDSRSIYSTIKPSFDIILFQDFWRFARNLQHLLTKLFLLFWTILGLQLTNFFRNNNKNNFALICCKFLANLQKYWNNAMSNHSLILANMDLFATYLAVMFINRCGLMLLFTTLIFLI